MCALAAPAASRWDAAGMHVVPYSLPSASCALAGTASLCMLPALLRFPSGTPHRGAALPTAPTGCAPACLQPNCPFPPPLPNRCAASWSSTPTRETCSSGRPRQQPSCKAHQAHLAATRKSALLSGRSQQQLLADSSGNARQQPPCRVPARVFHDGEPVFGAALQHPRSSLCGGASSRLGSPSPPCRPQQHIGSARGIA